MDTTCPATVAWNNSPSFKLGSEIGHHLVDDFGIRIDDDAVVHVDEAKCAPTIVQAVVNL
jgi:hypothetical protein